MFQTIWSSEDIEKVLVAGEKYGTPFYFFDTDKLSDNIRKLRQTFPESVKICFSLKSNPWFAEAALREADYLELCSAGEIHICRKLGLPMSKISAGGVSKTQEECDEIADCVPRCVSAESLRQVQMLSESAKSKDVSLNIFLRLTSGNQFGMTAEEIAEILRTKDRYPNLAFKGLHYYSGTNKKKISKINADFDYIESVLEKLNGIESVELGTGLGVPLFQGRTDDDFDGCLNTVAERLEKLSRNYEVIFESGRLLSTDTGIYVTSITDIKKNDGKEYWIVDGGIHHLSYYGQLSGKPHPFLLKYPQTDGDTRPVTICGSLCTAFDLLVNEIEMPQANYGDKLVFMNTGAYSVTDARSLFLSHDLPAVLLGTDGRTECLRASLPTYNINCV